MEKNLVTNEKSLDLAASAIVAIDAAEVRKAEVTPVDIVEGSVANFLGKLIDVTVESRKLSQSLEQSLEQDLDEMTVTEKITLFNIDRSSTNDRWFKILSPTIGLLTARQQALIQAASKENQQAAAVQVNVGATGTSRDATVASSTSPEVVSGLNAIFQLAAARKANLEAEKANATTVEPE